MKLGVVSPAVKQLQADLNKQFVKAPLKADGHFGPKTKYFVERFQEAAGLEVDGIAGEKTLAALRTLKLILPIEKQAAPKGKPSKGPAAPIAPAPVQPGKTFIGPSPASGDYPPFANVMPEKMLERGTYAKGGPLGAIVHYTAGHDGARKTILGGIKSKFTYWCIERAGNLFCAHRARFWGYHAGESKWKNLLGGVSDDLIGIEINAYGIVKPVKGKPGKFVTYFGLEIDESEVRYTPGKDNQSAGYYHKYTPAQEAVLIETLLWLKDRFPTTFDFDRVLGHDEVSGKKGLGYFRKVDPGAALSMTMSELRAILKQKYAERLAARK